MKNYDHNTYNTGKGKHSYTVEAYKGVYKASEAMNFNVIANNRDQAARRVERDGWQVASVNMTG